MAVREIVLIGDPILEKKAEKVPSVTKKLVKIGNDMLETMYEANGVGLAAPQIGISRRLIVFDVDEEPRMLFNPVIIKQSGEEIDVEGCLSIPERWVYVKRFTELEVAGLNEKGRQVRIKAEGLLARVLQHEIDHLDGILILDRMIEEAVTETKKEGE
ncbi:MAG: peptide deformylase [Firmicutes bacterium]|nr:peptide deformylase [Bacillota bacterium]